MNLLASKSERELQLAVAWVNAVISWVEQGTSLVRQGATDYSEWNNDQGGTYLRQVAEGHYMYQIVYEAQKHYHFLTQELDRRAMDRLRDPRVDKLIGELGEIRRMLTPPAEKEQKADERYEWYYAKEEEKEVEDE